MFCVLRFALALVRCLALLRVVCVMFCACLMFCFLWVVCWFPRFCVCSLLAVGCLCCVVFVFVRSRFSCVVC